MAGHAVCTSFHIKKSILEAGVLVTEIGSWLTHEGTADTRLLPNGSKESMQAAFDTHGIDVTDLDKYNNLDMNCCAAQNVMSMYMARRSNATCKTNFPSIALTFAPKQVCDPLDNVSSFYRYAIAFSTADLHPNHNHLLRTTGE